MGLDIKRRNGFTTLCMVRSLKGEKITDNVSTVTIRIPKVQLLTSEVLIELIDKVKRGEEL